MEDNYDEIWDDDFDSETFYKKFEKTEEEEMEEEEREREWRAKLEVLKWWLEYES